MTNLEVIAALNSLLTKLETAPTENPFNLEEYISLKTALIKAIRSLKEVEELKDDLISRTAFKKKINIIYDESFRSSNILQHQFIIYHNRIEAALDEFQSVISEGLK